MTSPVHNLDADTIAIDGVPTHLRSGGIGAAESTHYGSFEQALKPGATATGARESTINENLQQIFQKTTHHPFAIDPLGGRDISIQTVDEAGDMPLDLIAALLGGAQESPYGATLRNPNLRKDIQQRMMTLYPHKPGPEVEVGPGNTPNAYLKRGLGAKKALNEAYQAYLENGDADAFKAMAKAALSDNAILEAHAWERNKLSAWERKLQNGPANQTKFPSNPLPWYSQALNMVTGQTPDMNTQDYHQSDWEKTTHVGPLSDLQMAISNANVSNKPDPEARKRYEELRYVAPKELMEFIDKSGKSDQGKYQYAVNAMAEQRQVEKASELAGIGAVKGFIGMGLSALPTMALGGPVLKGFSLGGARIVEAANASLKARMLGSTIHNPITNQWLNAASKGAAGMYGFQVAASGIGDATWDHPGSTALDLTPHVETLALGVGLGLFGHSIPVAWKKLTTRTGAAADIVSSIQEHTAPPVSENPHLKDTTPGSIKDPNAALAAYSRIIELMTPSEKRPRTLEEADELESLRPHIFKAIEAANRPTGGALTGRMKNVIAALEKGLPADILEGTTSGKPLEEQLSVFKDTKGNLPRELQGALARAKLAPVETGDGSNIVSLQQELLGAHTGAARIKAGKLAPWDFHIQNALKALDTGDAIVPKQERTFMKNKFKGLSSDEQLKVNEAVTQLQNSHPEIAQTIKEALAHHEHLSGDISTPTGQNALADILEKKPEVLTELNIPEGRIETARIKDPEHKAAAEKINTLLDRVEQEYPIHHGKSRFSDESEILRQPNALDLINKEPRRGAAFKNEDALNWHKAKLGDEFSHMENTVFNSETGKFEKFEELHETTTEPDDLYEEPC